MALTNDPTRGKTGTKAAVKALALPSYTVTSAPAAAGYTGRLIYVTNGAAGSPCLAYSNGTNWLRITLGAAIAAS